MAYDKLLTGERIRELRKSRGLTQVDVAKLRNVTQAAVAKQETGERSLGEDGVYWYAEYFSVSADYLIGLIDSPLHESALEPVAESQTIIPESDLASPEKIKAYIDALVEESVNKAVDRKFQK